MIATDLSGGLGRRRQQAELTGLTFDESPAASLRTRLIAAPREEKAEAGRGCKQEAAFRFILNDMYRKSGCIHFFRYHVKWKTKTKTIAHQLPFLFIYFKTHHGTGYKSIDSRL